MDVNLPDGRVLRNVPDGTTQAEILARLKAAGEDTSWATPKQPSGAEALAQQTGPLDALLVAGGKKVNDVINGLTQMYLGARGEDKALGGLSQIVGEQNAIYAPLKKERPFATGFGETLPAMAGGSTLLGGVAAAALPELLSYGTAGERAGNAAVAGAGSAAGTLLGRAIGRVLQPAGQGSEVLPQAARDAAQRVGYQLSPAEITQNPAMQLAENYLTRSPGSSGAMQARQLANQAALNKTAARAIGQVSDKLDEGTLAAAKSAIGGEFNRLEQATAPQLGTDLLNAAVKLDSANAARGAFRVPEIDKLVDKSLDLAAQGQLTGKAYKEVRSAISARAAEATDATVANAYRDIRAALDTAAEQSLSAADQKAWKAAREQWRAYKLLTTGNVAEAGNVSAARLASKVRAEGDALRTGAQGPLYDIARIGEAVKGAQNPNSGQLMQQMLYGNPVTGIPLAAANKTAQIVYANPLVQKYLANGLLDVGPTGQMLLDTSARPVGLLGLRSYLGAE